MFANSEGSVETARMRRLACDFAGRLCGKSHKLMSWLISYLQVYVDVLLCQVLAKLMHMNIPAVLQVVLL